MVTPVSIWTSFRCHCENNFHGSTRDSLKQKHKVQVYNCFSGNLNPLPMASFIKHLNTTILQYPNKLNRAYPQVYVSQNQLWYTKFVFLFCTLSAVQMFLRFQRHGINETQHGSKNRSQLSSNCSPVTPK